MIKIALAGRKEKLGNYIRAIEVLGAEPRITLDARESLACDGLLLPGGGDIHPKHWGEEMGGSETPDELLDEKQFAILDAFVAEKKPIFGICRGMQMINVYFGGSLIQDLIGKELHIQKDNQDQIHLAIAKNKTLMHTIYGGQFFINSAHHQGIARLGEGLEASALSEDGVTEAIEHESLPILGVQFHPERLCLDFLRKDAIDGSALFAAFLNMVR